MSIVTAKRISHIAFVISSKSGMMRPMYPESGIRKNDG